MVRVLIADDQSLVRAGFTVLIGSDPELEVVGEAANGAEAVKMARETRADVVLMDIRMPEMDGLEATRRIVGDEDLAGVKVLVLTTFEVDDYVFEALRAGASGFLLKDAPSDQLIVAVRSVAAGDALIDPVITRRLIARFAHAARPPGPGEVPETLSVLTARELDVLRLLARGLSNQEIARELVVEENTVKTHVSRTLTKLGLRDRVLGGLHGGERLGAVVVPGARLVGARAARARGVAG